MTKICSKCGEQKDQPEFYKSSKTKDGLQRWCKACSSENSKIRNSDPQFRNRRATHLPIPGTLLVCRDCETEKDESLFDLSPSNLSGRSTQCKDCRAEQDLRRRRDKGIPPRTPKQTEDQRLQKHREEARIYRKENREAINERARINGKIRRKTDPLFAIKVQLGNRLGDAVRNGQKAGSGVRDLGCSIEELKSHLESKFRDGMTWENRGHGKGKWNIDHIIPLAAFDLTQRQHVVLACNYLNLQPLWHEENMSKGDKLDFRL